MQKSLLLTLILSILVSTSMCAAQEEKKNICLMAASLPWIFGPYQAQMYSLSLYLNEKNEYKNIYWLPRIYQLKLPRKGIYRGFDEVRRELYPKKTITPPADMRLDHLQFLGSLDSSRDNMISSSMLNAYAEEYGIDVFVLLLDSVNYLPNLEHLNAAVVVWKPLHTERLHIGMSDFWAVRNYHGVAALAPFARDSIQSVLTTKNSIGGVPTYVDYVPHHINREQLEDYADKGRTKVQSLLPSHVNLKTFFVLIQGGNYDNLDRKGWSEAIQAYGIFRHSLPEDANVHLYLHAMESYLVEQDANGGEKAPPAVLPQGVKLSHRLSLSGLKLEQDYTLDMTQHEPTTVAALKQRSSLCLHTSRAEGFGLISVECQALGKPVVTTNYTAMKDYTKFGIAVDPDQFSFYDHVDLACPPVQKIVSALQHYYQQHLDLSQKKEAKAQRQMDIKEARNWIDSEFSIENVGKRMDHVIQKAITVYEKRREYQQLSLSTPNYYTDPIFQIIQGEVIHTDLNYKVVKPWVLLLPDKSVLDNLDLDYQKLNNYAWAMSDQDNQKAEVMYIPTFDHDHNVIPFVDQALGGPNTSLPYLLKSHWFHKMYGMSHRRVSIVWQALLNTQDVKGLPDGLAKVLASPFQEL